jgi:hypothetical protein
MGAQQFMASRQWRRPPSTKWVFDRTSWSGNLLRNRARAAYNRAEYLGDRRAMMNRWADYLDGHAGENVVHFKTIA